MTDDVGIAKVVDRTAFQAELDAAAGAGEGAHPRR